MEHTNPVIRAAHAAAAQYPITRGPNAALADLLGVSAQAVSQWVDTGHMPLERAIRCEEILGIPRKELLDPALVQAVCGSC